MSENLTLERIVRDHGRFIQSTLVRFGIRWCDLADVEQEVLRAVAGGLPRFDPTLASRPQVAVRCWLFGICTRQAASHRRAWFRRGEVLCPTEELDQMPSPVVGVEGRLIGQERRALLMRLLACVEPQRRAVVIAYELEGIPMADIAAALGIGVNTAWNLLRLARRDLRAAARRHAARREG